MAELNGDRCAGKPFGETRKVVVRGKAERASTMKVQRARGAIY
jgi:hypothetical protein